MMFFAELLDRHHLRHVLDGYLEMQRGHVARMTSGECGPSGLGHDFVHGLGLAVHRSIVEYMERYAQDLRTDVENRRGAPAPAAPKAAE